MQKQCNQSFKVQTLHTKLPNIKYHRLVQRNNKEELQQFNAPLDAHFLPHTKYKSDLM